MGLFDSFGFDPNDPRKAGLMQMAAALLANKSPNLGQALGQAIPQGLMGYHTTQGLNDRRGEEAQQREARGLMIQQQRQQQADQDRIRGIFSQNTMPGNLVQNDDEGNAMPAAPQGFNMQGLKQGLLGAGPAGLPHLGSIMSLMQKEQPIKLGRDDRLVDPTTHKEVLGAAPEKPPTGMVNTPQGWQYDPAYLKGQTDLAAARRPQVNVNTNLPPLEKKEQGDKGALNVKNFGDVQGLAASARRENSILSAMERNPIDTSKAAPMTATAAAWLASAGMGGDRVKEIAGNAQAFNAAAMDLVLQKQLAQKGPQTESDARRLEQTVASLGNTKEGNAAIIAFSKASNNRTIAQEKFYNDWWKKNKTFEGADAAWLNGEGGRSLFEDPSLKKYGGQSGDGWSAKKVG